MSAAGSGAATARVRLCPGIGGAGATVLETARRGAEKYAEGLRKA
jgi:hypothetical protein